MLLLCASCWSISSYLNNYDQMRLRSILESGLSSDDLGVVDHAVRGLFHLGHEVPGAEGICSMLEAKMSLNAEDLFHIAKASSVLKCSLPFPEGLSDKLQDSVVSSSSMSELMFVTGAMTSLGYGLSTPKVLRALNAILKKEDSIVSLGQAFHIASALSGDVSSIFDRVEDAIVQADQVCFIFLS